MSTKTKDGGAAFPRQLPEGGFRPDEAALIVEKCRGMSLRDYFAAKAMQGMLASPELAKLWSPGDGKTKRERAVRFLGEDGVLYVWWIADQMLLERDKCILATKD